jgi:hypothetical protein
MSEPVKPQVVELVDAGVPADQGLSALGLLMQLAGNVLAAYAALITFQMLFVTSQLGDQSKDLLWVILALGLSIGRSLLHRSAGSQLVYGGGEHQPGRLAGVRRYVTVALIQSVVLGAVMRFGLHLGNVAALGVVAGLAVWPVTLAVLLRLPRFKRFHDELPLTEDKGFEGASIFMTVLGLCGAIGTGTGLYVMLQTSNRELQSGPNVLITLSLILLVVRSVIQIQAGVSGLRETSVDRSVELANRYANFGIISSFCGGGALMLFVMSSAMSVFGLALVCCMCWLLIAWPMIIRKFFSDRQFADLLAGDAAPVHRRAPDAGLTWLGWLLIGHVALTASFLLPQIASGEPATTGRFESVFMLAGTVGIKSAWWNIGALVLQAWAGYELVRMSPQSRIIASVFAVVSVAVTVYVNWPLIELLRHSSGFDRQAVLVAPLALSLVMPIATLLLVHRKIAPTARARFRAKAA